MQSPSIGFAICGLMLMILISALRQKRRVETWSRFDRLTSKIVGLFISEHITREKAEEMRAALSWITPKDCLRDLPMTYALLGFLSNNEIEKKLEKSSPELIKWYRDLAETTLTSLPAICWKKNQRDVRSFAKMVLTQTA